MTTARGFTLIEMAIVLVIITILIGGLAMPLSAQIQARRIAETRADMQAIHDALIGYAMSHTIPMSCSCTYDASGVLTTSATTCPGNLCPTTGTPDNTFPLTYARHHLPCPDTNNDGREETRDGSGNCPLRGGLPWVTLGVKGQDAWGNRYTYAAALKFSGNLNGFVSTPIPDEGSLNVYPDSSCLTASVAEKAVAVVVSHGANGRGAQSGSGGTPLPAASVPVDERHNLATPSPVAPCTNTSFVSHTPTDSFDDLLIWLSSPTLFNRVCLPGGCQ
jgi:prepilin-type N-terminal cleavage/methylation domain-containing protein